MTTTENQIGVNMNLQRQDLKNLDISNLTALSPEVISRQATINIGTIGHVAHGKSTVVKAISGVQTVRFKNELERNITIKLERISYERLLKISESPKLLSEYEEREQKKLKRLKLLRILGGRVPSVDSSYCCHDSEYLGALERGASRSPSSGYESVNDNASNFSVEANPAFRLLKENQHSQRKRKFINAQKQQQQQQQTSTIPSSRPAKRRAFSTASGYFGAGTPPNNKRCKNIEYVIEDIESIESINGEPIFFVKWLNYPSNENTWESLPNLVECELLERFIEQQYEFYNVTISEISAQIEAEIESQTLAFETSKLHIPSLDVYEPLLLKCDLILLAQFRKSNSRSQKEPARIRKRVIGAMLLQPFYNMRKQQLQNLRDWQQRMNKVECTAPIMVENNVDLEVPDMSFQYIKESFPGAGVSILQNPPIGCQCAADACNPRSKCCAYMAGSYFAYDQNGRLRIRPGEAIYECNNACMCGSDCVNRVIQRGRNNALCLFKTANECGWGVRTERQMRKGDYVCEYVGEIITAEEANERGEQYDAIGRTYLFDLDYNMTAESVYTIDAAVHGNISHFINHSCDPNLAVFPFWINNLDVNMPRLAFFTLRTIRAGEELTFDYIRSDSNTGVYNNLSQADKVTCRCGAANCRKVLF